MLFIAFYLSLSASVQHQPWLWARLQACFQACRGFLCIPSLCWEYGLCCQSEWLIHAEHNDPVWGTSPYPRCLIGNIFSIYLLHPLCIESDLFGINDSLLFTLCLMHKNKRNWDKQRYLIEYRTEICRSIDLGTFAPKILANKEQEENCWR